MEESRKVVKARNSICNRIHRERIYSDTALYLLPKSQSGAVAKLKVASRLPLKDLSSNISTIAFSNKTSVSSNTENDNIDSNTKKVVISGYISKVTEKRLIAKEVINVVSESSLKSGYSKNKSISIVKNLTQTTKPDRKLFDNCSTSIIKPLTANIFVGILKDIKKPARKTSLLHKSNPNYKKRNEAYVLDIYNMEYLENIIQYQLKSDWKYVIGTGSLKRYNEHARTAMIHVLNKAVDYFEQPVSILYTTVRLFDYILQAADIPLHLFELVSYAIMWIVIKLDNTTNFPLVKKLAALSSTMYTVSDLLKMEKKILNFFDFNIHVPDLTTYIHFYIMGLSETSDLLLNSVNYILECYTLNKDFSTVIPSMQAAGAVCLALDILQSPPTIWNTLTNTLGYYNHEQLENIMHVMLEQIHKIQDPSYIYRFPYEKYAAKEKQQVSIVILGKLIAS